MAVQNGPCSLSYGVAYQWRWAAIHPNIPHRQRPFKATLRRLELMFWTIAAPEILPAWALNQRLAAMTIRDFYNEAKGVFVFPLPVNMFTRRGQVMRRSHVGFGRVWRTGFLCPRWRRLQVKVWLWEDSLLYHEPVEGNSTSPEATAAASDGLVNVQPKAFRKPMLTRMLKNHLLLLEIHQKVG